jgi:hypothetical protein
MDGYRGLHMRVHSLNGKDLKKNPHSNTHVRPYSELAKGSRASRGSGSSSGMQYADKTHAGIVLDAWLDFMRGEGATVEEQTELLLGMIFRKGFISDGAQASVLEQVCGGGRWVPFRALL